MMLMCKNTPVYDIENEKTLNYNLLPGLMAKRCRQSHLHKMDEIPLFLRYQHDSTEIKGHHIRTGSAYAH